MFDPAAKLIELAGRRPKVVVAFSGGLDSTVLAHALACAKDRLGSLRLVHIDHGLQDASGDWSRHCRRQARAWRVPFSSIKVTVRKRRGDSPEAAAREARYTALASGLEAGEVLVTAQHRDDQVETLLLQLFRGAGVSGLAAMPKIAPFGESRLARPLLDTARAELETYARAHQLHWVEDPTNAQTAFGRNYLRHRVLPVIRERWPGVDTALARSARHMSAADSLLDGIAARDLATAADGRGLAVAALRALPVERRRNALRGFIARANVEQPPASQLTEICGALLAARADAQPEVRWPGAMIRRRSGRLELRVTSEEPGRETRESASKSWSWMRQREFLVNDGGDKLVLIDDPAGEVDLDKLPQRLELRSRKGGETLRPGSRARTQSLKKLLQAAKLTVEQRARLPLLFGEGPKGRLGGKLLAAGDRWLDASVSATVKSRRRARLVWSSGGKN